MGLARFWFGSHLSTPSRSFVPPTQNIQPCSANGRGAGKSRRRTAAARKVSKHRSRREDEGGREGDQPTWEGLLAVPAGGKEGEGGGREPANRPSIRGTNKISGQEHFKRFMASIQGRKYIGEALPDTPGGGGERESEEEAGGAQTQPRADRHAPRSLPLLHEPTFGKCSLPSSLSRFFL